MRVCIAQTKPVKGDIESNIKNHLEFIKKAVGKNADIIVFPELSLTGYEPTLTNVLVTTQNDERLKVFQEISDLNKIVICVGLPTGENGRVFISMIIFQPEQERITYSKQYLYHTEVGYFTAGQSQAFIKMDEKNIIAPAICFELSNRQHVEEAKKNNANIYIASVLNSVSGVENDLKKLSEIAQKYKMTTFMANYVGYSGGYECAGKSSVWNDQGVLIEQLDTMSDSLLVYDIGTKQVIKENF